MKNKLQFLFNSIKQSIINKPIAFVLLFFVFFATTICCSIPSRWLTAVVNEEFSQSQYISFQISGQDFMKNNIVIGDFIRDNISMAVSEEEEVYSYFNVNNYNVLFIANDKQINLKSMRACFVVTQQHGITESNILNKEKVVSIKDKIAFQYGISIGDKINLYGNEFIVIDICEATYDFVIPYNIQINKWYSCTPSAEDFIGKPPSEQSIQCCVKNIKSSEIKPFEKGLKQLGYKLNTSFNYGVFICVVLIMSMLLFGILSSVSIIGYWLKCNNRKYATFKILGCSPALLACTMIIETMLIAFFAIGLGLIVDYLIGINMKFEMPLGSFTWLHYLSLIGGTLVSTTTMVVIAVIRRAVVMPANTKYNV